MDLDSYRKARQACVWWLEPPAVLVQVSGPDAASYLQTQITQDVERLAPGQGAYAALVDRKARIQALFSVHRQQPERFWCVPDQGADTLFAHLEQFHFIEDVSVEALTGWRRLRLEGPGTPEILLALSGRQLSSLERWACVSLAIPGGSAWLIPDSFSGERGAQLLVRETALADLVAGLEADYGVSALSPEAYEQLRVEAGWPRPGAEILEDTQLPETGLEKIAVSYSKGCYLGQEVLARIKTYGVVPQALMGLVWPPTAEAPQIGPLVIAGKQVGRLSSVAWSPQRQAWVGLAYLHKKWRDQPEVVFDAPLGTVALQRLPLYRPAPPEVQAQGLYDEALEVFAQGDPEAESRAVVLLEAALKLHPGLADAYESLGVILSRLGRHAEAISVMQQMAQVAPEEPMVHTNLSRFYMLEGDKATAEFHMAEATRLSMLQQQQHRELAQLQAQEKARRQELMEMFREVLESEDPEDLVANFGLGKGLLDEGHPAEAIPYLEKAVAVDRLYSAAWLQLGKAWRAAQQPEKAREVWLKGVQVASEKGDLMPLKEMEQGLAGL
ncbi:MAG: tetratricopeptide repeat protein [Candidatus Sericytochromatia bacterium]